MISNQNKESKGPHQTEDEDCLGHENSCNETQILVGACQHDDVMLKSAIAAKTSDTKAQFGCSTVRRQNNPETLRQAAPTPYLSIQNGRSKGILS
jgi:hypothetical protein